MLHQLEKKLLASLGTKAAALADAATAASMSFDEASRACAWLEEKGFVEIIRTSKYSYELSQECKKYLEVGFPELRVLQKASRGQSISQLDDEEKKIGLSWARKYSWVKIGREGKLEITGVGTSALSSKEIERAAKYVKEGRIVEKEILDNLILRNLVSAKESKTILVSITEQGKKALNSESISANSPSDEINQLNRDLIAGGKWKGKTLRPYNIKEDVATSQVGKRHIISRFRHKIKSIFSEMGFVEMEGDIVESSFWNFDALFQPQDHPARELADTFYVEKSFELPADKKIVAAVKRAHEKGWKYSWSGQAAKQAVLRTHTTAVSARYVAKSAHAGPKKYFSVGKVFRKEATDFKHLAEFYQVEGIVIWEEATLSDLLGILSQFYRRIGFEKIRFRPSYFPYTEPSLEVEVYFEDKKAWMELGGAGIFRPEVSIPLCGRYPVLAWGLSLERPLMLLHDIKDIRKFYQNQIGWLRSMPIK